MSSANDNTAKIMFRKKILQVSKDGHVMVSTSRANWTALPAQFWRQAQRAVTHPVKLVRSCLGGLGSLPAWASALYTGETGVVRSIAGNKVGREAR